MVVPEAAAGGESSTGLKANIVGLLCYLGIWITGIIFLVIEKKSQFVRFHAAQSLAAARGVLARVQAPVAHQMATVGEAPVRLSNPLTVSVPP